MRKPLFSVLGLVSLIVAMASPVLAFPAVPVESAGQSAGAIVRADYYYYEHHRYHHRHWDEHYHHWHYYN